MNRNQPAPSDLELLFEEGAAELARSYAQALLNVADQDGRGEDLLDELDELVDDVWNGQPDFAALLSYGLSAPEDRDRVLHDVFEGRTDPLLYRFLGVLGRRDRLVLLPLIARAVRDLWNRRHRRVPVTVRSARALDDDLRRIVQDRLNSMLDGATPMMTEEVDSTLIGGLVIQIGDQLYDASVRSRLARLRQELVKNRISEVRRRGDLVVD